MRYLFIIVFLALIIIASRTVKAECWYDGRPYPTGTVINYKTCNADGTWR